MSLIGVLAGGYFWGQPDRQTTAFPSVAADQPPLSVEVQELKPISSYQVFRIYTGEIAAPRTSDLGFERAGRLMEILVNEGDRVQAGDPLARIDVQNLLVQREQLQAQVAQAQAQLTELETGPRSEAIAAAAASVRDLENQLALQKVQRQRRESLYNEGAISKEQLDGFVFGVEALAARLAQVESNLQELLNGTRPEQVAAQQAVVEQLLAGVQDLDVTINKSTLVAPFNGIISTRQVNEGTVVSPGQSVIRLVEDSTPEARIGLPVSVANEITLGELKPVQINSQNYNARVVAILPEVDPATRTRLVVLDLEDLTLLDVAPGQTIRWELPEVISTEGNAYWLPTDALTQGLRGLWSCYILQPQADSYSVIQQSVEVLYQDGDQVLVRGTIQPGDQVVASGVHRLVPGQRVSPTPQKPT
ncbi:MAG: efflux RND transporter periplasmic adaptor subunit [Synechococcaceae cyanobacterium SM2_3_1]|nr:efflux RND transporter periplasmic adaptor subunit [Synechococcaceae cyanobacterium SM2_3_1]